MTLYDSMVESYAPKSAAERLAVQQEVMQLIALAGLARGVAVKAKPECCSEQNRNGAREPVKRASARDFASKMAIVES